MVRPSMGAELPGLTALAAITAAAVCCTALAYALYFRILATAGATNLLLVTLLMPIGALWLGTALLHEHSTPPRSAACC